MRAIEAQRDLRSPALDLPFHAAHAPLSHPQHPRSLADTLAAVGAMPSMQIEKARGLLRRWFRSESTLLAALNTALSLLLFALALTMTFAGLRIAQAIGLLVSLNETANAISPYAGVALLSLGVLRFAQHLLARDNSAAVRIFGFVEASLLLAGGAWAEAVAWYTGAIPDMLKPQLAMAGGAITANLIFFSTVVIPLFKPAMAAGFGALLTAKQIKTAAVSGGGRTRWYVALIGLAASACALMIGMDAGQRSLAGHPNAHVLAMDARARQWAQDFAPPFAAGTWCRVSDTFGPRRNPFWGTMVAKPVTPVADAVTPAADTVSPVPDPVPVPTPATAVTSPVAGDGDAAPATVLVPYAGPRIEYHPGVDLAVREGTPVYAMVDGRVVYAGFDTGFGNMVALHTISRAGETTVLNGHMKALNVQPGQAVAKGALIGWVGSTGHSTGPHLHVQVCPQGVAAHGTFKCGTPANPYEVWATLSAIAHLSCAQGPVGF